MRLNKHFLWSTIFGLVCGIFWWLSGVAIYDTNSLFNQNGFLWLVPSLKSLIIKLILCEIAIFIIFSSPLNNKYKKFVSFVEHWTIKKISYFLFIGTLTTYIFFSLLLVHPNTKKNKRYYLLTGDEPHYLLITHSLVFDRDFNLYNNVENKDSLLYYDRAVNGFSGGVELFGRYAKGKKITAQKEYWTNKRYSNLNFGLPIILSPWYWLGVLWDNQIRLCIILFLNILTSFLAINIFLLSYKISNNKFGSLFATLCAGLSMPIIFYSRQVYPDLPAALFLIYSFRKICEKDFNSIFKALSISLCISFLPWLHEKYILLALLCSFYFVYQWWRQGHTGWGIGVFSAPFLVSLCLQMRYYYLLFGVPYPINMHPGFYMSALLKGALGLFLDSGHGLIPYAPIYIISIIGIVLAIKERKNIFWFLAFPIGIFLTTACFSEWWGGFCPAGRYLVPVIPFLTPFIAYGYEKTNKGIVLILGLIGICIGLGGMFLPGRLYTHMHPFISYTKLKGIFPNMIEPNFSQYRLAIIWIILIFMVSVFYNRKKHNNLVFGFVVLFLFLSILNSAKINLPQQLGRIEKLEMLKKLNAGYILIGVNKKILEKIDIVYEAEELLIWQAKKISDPSSNNGIAVYASANNAGYVLYGPYTKLYKGIYDIRFRLKTTNNSEKAVIAALDVASQKGKTIHVRQEIKGTDFKQSNEYQDFIIPFTLDNNVSFAEFRVYYTGRQDIWIDKITVLFKLVL